MIIVVIGVMGAGKTTVGAALAARLGWRFFDADDFHSAANWAKLTRGEALGDADRMPWLARLRDEIAGLLARNEPAVLACSALRQAYRDALVPPQARAGDVRFVHLDAEPALTAARVARREGHRAATTLLGSQFDALEEPRDALRVDASAPVDALVSQMIDTWRLPVKP
jgi:carbohydrate kinase (thermoresistant glucokinase family)